MKSCKCNKCENSWDTKGKWPICMNCGTMDFKRIWTTSRPQMNGHGFKDNFGSRHE
jgi:hypothetical protein